MILSNFLKNETIEAGFFNKEDVTKIIEKHQIEVLKLLN